MDLLRDRKDAALSGLEALQSSMAAGKNAPIADTIGFSLTEVIDGSVTFTSTPTPKVYNPIGSVHGGFAATILDSACGCAVHTKLSATQGYTTLELKIAYHRPLTVKSGETRCVGTVKTFGRRVAFAEAELFDEAGNLCASATSTLLVFDLKG